MAEPDNFHRGGQTGSSAHTGVAQKMAFFSPIAYQVAVNLEVFLGHLIYLNRHYHVNYITKNHILSLAYS